MRYYIIIFHNSIYLRHNYVHNICMFPSSRIPELTHIASRMGGALNRVCVYMHKSFCMFNVRGNDDLLKFESMKLFHTKYFLIQTLPDLRYTYMYV